MLFGLANHSGESLENKSAAIYFAQLPQIDTLGWLGEANINIFCNIYFAQYILHYILHNFPKLTPWAGWVKLTSIFCAIYFAQYTWQYIFCKIYFAMYFAQLLQIDTLGWLGEANISRNCENFSRN